MEFRLPEELANKLVDYDQTLRQTKPKKEVREVSDRLKRKTKLAFPCPEIFFDLTVDQVYEIYEDLCFSTAANRYHVVHSAVNPMNIRYLIVWDKCSQTKQECWYCWKVGTKECPIILRYWDESIADDEYTEFCADQSLKDFRITKENPFTSGYKVERLRYDAVNSFLQSVSTQLELPYPSGDSAMRTQLEFYAASKFFYQYFFGTKDEQSFYPAKWLAGRTLYSLAESRFNLVTNSTIIKRSTERS
jgi:hypothetical protein